MNSKFINDFCKKNNILVYYDDNNKKFSVRQYNNILYQSSDYNDCIYYIVEVMINDKHANNR